MSQTTYAAALPLLKQDWGMSAQQSGLVSSAYYFGFLVSLFVVGFMADRLGAKRTYLGTSALAAASALAFALFARDFPSAFMLFGLTGMFAGGSYTPGLMILAQRFPSRARGRANGFYIAASSAGYALSLLLSAWMLAVSGWRLAFVVTCSGPALGMLLGAWVLRRVPNMVAPPSPGQSSDGLIKAVVTNKPGILMILGYTAHSPVLSTAQTELVSPRYLGAAYSLRSVLGFGAGSISPWVFGLVLDWGRADGGSQLLTFGLAFSTLGLGGLLCPLLMLWLRRLPESSRMAGGMR